MAGCSVVNIYRKKCPHREETRIISVVRHKETFEMFESQFKCPNHLLNISLSSSENGPWSALDDEILSDLYQAPMGVVFRTFPDTKYMKLQCVEDQAEESQPAAATPPPPKNAFQILMMSSAGMSSKPRVPSKKRTSAGVPDGLSSKDGLYNDLITWMEERNLLFLNADNEGKYFAQVLTNSLWYVTNHHDTINERCRREKEVLGIPPEFDKFNSYNDHKKKKQKCGTLDATQMKTHSDILLSLCCKPYMRSSPAWEQAYQDIKKLAESFSSYSIYLKNQNEKIQFNQNLDHPVRQVSEDVCVRCIQRNWMGIREEYKHIDKVVALADFNEPVFFDDKEHLLNPFQNSMQRHRFFENLQLSVTVDMYKYSPGGSIITVYCLIKVQDNRAESDKCSQIASNLLKIKPRFPEYHTREMKRSFKSKVSNVASVQPSLLDTIYKELTLDASKEVHPVTQQRIRMIFMGETGLLPDLRKLNPGRPSGQYDLFFEKLGELIEEYTAADDRRHNIAHMSEILSLKDLITQTKERCPNDTSIPSAALVRLQFCPRNPYSHAAMTFTSKIPVQYKIQRRQLRIAHPDDHYCNALFKYERSLAVELGKDCALFFCDDKAKVQIGEPDVPLSTGVRGKKVLALKGTTLSATDHDLHHKGSLTPSVYMQCNVPDNIDKPFYRGKVAVVVNDSVFQSSNPMRHATALLKQIQNLEEKPKVVLKFSDGGTDHRTNLEHVKLAAICLFKELDLDLYVAARCAPGQSWINPAERIMSILNIGLQNCALSREKGSENFERTLSKCISMDNIRSKGEIRDEWEASLEPVRRTVENRFRKLALKDEPFHVMSPMQDNEIDHLSRHIDILFTKMDKTKLVKSHTSKVLEYRNWVEIHCRLRQYSFQIRKCNDIGCCSPSLSNTNWLPDPVLDADTNHYRSFESVYGTDTTEKDRPTLMKKTVEDQPVNSKKKNQKKETRTDPITNLTPDDPALQGEASVFTAQNARYTTTCTECEKPRLIYSKSKLTERQNVQLALLLSDFEFTCGSPVTPPEHSLHGNLFTRMNINCGSPMEVAYYSSSIGRRDICYYCGATDAETNMELKKEFKTVLPLCQTCKDLGQQVVTLRPYGKKSKT